MRKDGVTGYVKPNDAGLHLRLTIPDRGPGVKVAATCDYCGKLAPARMIGNDMVCDRCMGITAPAEEETELEQCRR